MRRSISAFAVLAGVVSLAIPLAARADDPLTIRTANGRVHGFVNGPERAFLNIPFAAPPIGALRFRPAQPPLNWTGVIDGTQFGTICSQQDGNGGLVGGEDCLNVNVYVPLHAAANARLPVMVYLFGGGNLFGDNTLDVSGLVAHGVVVVVPNYRVNVFGWLGNEKLVAENGGTSPNFATTDQMQALRWTRDNIAAFGGDPTRVTLFGTSAGSNDTVAILAVPSAKDLYQRAIVQSGYALQFRLADAERFGGAVAANAGCDESVKDLPACLRAVPTLEMMNAWFNTQDTINGGNIVGPYIDGLLVVDQPWNYVASHGSVPLITGFVREEAWEFIYGWFDDPFTIGLQDFADAWYQYTPGGWYPERTDGQFLTDTALYPIAGQERPIPLAPDYPLFFHSFAAFFTDYLLGCTSKRIALGAAGHDRTTPVFRYVLEHKLEFTGGADWWSVLAPFAGFHTEQDVFTFNAFTSEIDPTYVPTAGELELSFQMGQYWANFAATGDPNGAGLPPWPRFDPLAQLNIVLDDPIRYGARDQALQCEAFVDGLIDEYVPMPASALLPGAASFGCGGGQPGGLTTNCPITGYLPQ